jgi:type II secretory pathway pseudopilin PulG
LTLVEVMVTLVIFLFMAALLLLIVQQTSRAWARGERDRLLHERAAGALDHLAADLSLALGADPTGVDSVRAKFIGDESDGCARVMFVRAFEAGPERALTLFAADGEPSDLTLRPFKEDDDDSGFRPQGAADRDDFTGTKLGDYKPLGGMAAVAWFVSDRTLYRGIRSPVDGLRLSSVANPASAALIAEDVLFFDIDYWHQATSSWQEQGRTSGKHGPEKIWDSTRGITADPLKGFAFHRGAISLNDPEDDIFPSKVRVTLTVDSPMPRCVFTQLSAPIGPGDEHIPVESVRGFPPGDDNDSFLLIDREWIRYSRKSGDEFLAVERGARGTVAMDHDEEATVRVGRTFRRTIYLRSYRDDWSSDKEYFESKRNPQSGRR